MIGKPPPRPPGPARKLDRVELRIENLRRELEAETEPASRAAILYQMGALYERDLERAPDAVAHYAQSRAAAPGFQPALIAQLRIAERDPTQHDLTALRSAQADTASSPAVTAAALTELASHSDEWVSLLHDAIQRSPEPVVPALILEWLAEARGDRDAVRDALLAQAEHATDPNLRAAVFLDLALSELEAERPDEAIAALERACDSDAVVWQARSLQRRTASEHARWDVFVGATTAMAGLLESAINADDPSDPLNLSVPEDERLPMAAFLWQEAAACAAARLDDTDAAASFIDSALRLRPDQRTAHLQALQVAGRADDPAAVERASQWFRATAPSDPAFVAHQVRQALGSDDHQRALSTLRDAAANHPDSEYAQAALDVALLRSADESAWAERAQRLLAQAETTEGEARARLEWRAAQLTAMRPTASGEAQALYTRAADSATASKERILREALGAALASRQSEAVLERCDALLQCDLAPAEEAMLAFTRYDVTQNSLGANQDAQLLLRDSIGEAKHRTWAPQIARALAAWSGNTTLLAQAHESISEITSGDTRVGHLCAAGQAYARARDWGSAERVLRQALSAAPDDRYIVNSLESVLREGGRPEDVVTLARERSQANSDAAVGELSLLLAGATAERSGNLIAARQAYEQALGEAPASPSAALALLDIARRQDDAPTRLRAYGHLCDTDLGAGVPELYALLRGDALRALGDRGTSAAYERALEHPRTALAAAASLMSTPIRLTTADQRSAAEEVLAEADDTIAQGSGFDAAYGALRASLGERNALGSDAWLQLAALAPSEALRAESLLQGLRAQRVAQGADGADELFLLAQEAEGLAESHAEAGIAIDEALTPGDDAEFRAAAVKTRLGHSDAVGRASLDAAYSRALVDAGQGVEAVALLSQAVDERPDDLALWETMRGAARQAGQWPLVAQACERLAPFVEGSLKADLLEEAGVVRLDCLEQYPQAEDLFRRALDEDPSRDVAFRRLHDLLAEREDAEALEALVSDRLALGGPKDRLDLLYERARLLRGFSDRPGALEVLDELFTSEPEHAGALALAAEVHVSLEQWAEAVGCLQRLSKAGIPEGQRRVAHLGAADFLETHLDQKEAALEELRAIEALGLADPQVWVRIGSLEANFDNHGAAVDAYRRALQTEPANSVAIARLAALLDGTDKDEAVSTYEGAIWERVAAGELDGPLLDGIADAARWRGHEQRVTAVRAVQAALGLASGEDSGGADLTSVSVAAVWDPNANRILQQIVVRAGPALSKDRFRTKKAAPTDPIYAEIERICQRFGSRAGVIGLSDECDRLIARTGADGEVDWVLPRIAKGGLDEAGLFTAGRLAWAAPHGAGGFLEEAPQKVAGTLAAVLRVSRCELDSAGPALPAVDVRLRRATRKAVREVVGELVLTPASLVGFARSLHRSADRAGLLASGDISAALASLLNGRVTLDTLNASTRALDLLQFWLDAESALWRTDG